MSESSSPPPVSQFALEVPDGMRNGTYADFVSIWTTPYEFTLDFALIDRPEVDPNVPNSVRVPCRVVSRVKIPLHLAEQLLQTLATTVNQFEDEAGRIHRPGEDQEPGPNAE